MKKMKKNTGDSTAVAKVVPSVKGLQKANNHATSYNKNVFHKPTVPNYPYGQEFKAVKAPMNKTIAVKGPVKKK
jgi:hypothetical protein